MCFVDTSFIPELKVDITNKIFLSSYISVVKLRTLVVFGIKYNSVNYLFQKWKNKYGN